MASIEDALGGSYPSYDTHIPIGETLQGPPLTIRQVQVRY
jgi:hypothetical protein